MAIEKQIEKENGVILNYHRIVAINKITNMLNTIEINSYINVLQREKEKEYQDLQKKNIKEKLNIDEKERLTKGINVLVETDYINIPYDEKMTIEQAYEYVKNIEKYKESIDV